MNPPGSDQVRPRRRLLMVAVFMVAALLAAAAILLGQSSRQGGAAPNPARSSSSNPATVGLSAGTRTTTRAPAPAAPARTPTPAPVSGPPSSPSQPGVPGPWRLVFADDFAGRSLDSSRWVTCYDWNVDGCTNAGNHELEWYAPEQVAIGNGAATLTAVRKPTTGTDGRIHPWASGMLSTGRPSWNARPRFTFTYGYVEALIKMPSTAAMFPAFWLLTADETGRPEVDIAELIASRTSVLMNLHWTTAAGTHAQAPRTFGPVDFSAGYHEFAVDWEPNAITWYVDGVSRYTVTDRLIIPAVPMETLFTLAVGFPGPPPAGVSTDSMSIKRVRIWQR